VSTLDNLQKHAKRWLKALREGDASARERLRRAHPNVPERPALRHVQHALARERGYESWIAMKAAIAQPLTTPELETLLRAAGLGGVDEVARILDAHPDLINARGYLRGNTGARTALHYGVHHIDVVRTLLDRGADPNIRDEGDNAYPIHFAAERGELDIVRLLVEHGADPIGEGTTHELDVVGWAVCFEYGNHVEVARYLLAHGARYTLFTATALGEADVIRELARTGADVNRRMDRTNHRRTALHLAVIKKQPRALAALVDAEADVNVEDAAGLTALDTAALRGEHAMAQALIDAGATITLAAAVALDRPEDFERLLQTNPSLVYDNRRWARLVTRASSDAPAAVLEKLLRAAERAYAGLTIVNMADDRQTAVDGAGSYTPLHAAAFSGNAAAVEILLKHGADPRVRDTKYCGTPAGWARYAGHNTVADRILQADVDVFDAINFDRDDRIAAILDRDPGALDRPFKAYLTWPIEPREDQWWPKPDCTPLEWATSQQKTNAVRILTERGAAAKTPGEIAHAERVVTFLKSACWDHHTHGKADHRMLDRAAQRLLAADPAIATDSIYTAIVCGEIQEVRRILRMRANAARERGGARNWTPILYVAYTRFTHPPTIRHAVDIARLLLDHGADPNDFYMAGDARYSVLTGVAGEGEQDSPRQPYAEDLFELLLERGAEPFDIQVLYDTHFSGFMLWWLDLIYRQTIDTPRGEAWKDPEWKMLDMGGYGSGARFILEMAIRHRNVELARWALERGANPNAAPARDKRWPKHSLYEIATLDGVDEIAELLLQHGAERTVPTLGGEEAFVDACLRVDRSRANELLQEHPEYRESPRALFEAARRDRPDAIALLLDLGFPIDMQEKGGQRPLHEAALKNSLRAAQYLIDRGADIDAIEPIYGGAPIGWASHADHREMMDLLARYSRNIWTLCFRGYVDRVREILRDDPSLATQVTKDGITPLWWLPDEEDKAMDVVELLLAAGADPAIKSADGRTAADWARRRGMYEVADRILRG
jgi:uncharacterized protein